MTTAEGDKVTLSLAAKTERAASSYRARGRGENGDSQSLRAAEDRTQTVTQVKVGIEGDLNDKEMADIKKLIEAFGQFTQGNATAMGQFGSLESLATAKLSYSANSQGIYSSVRIYA